VHRVHRLDPVDTTQRGLIPVTTATRTLLDIAPRVQLDQLEEALDGACRRGQIHVAHLVWRLAELRRQGVEGMAKVDALLEHACRERGEESWLESAYLRILRRAGLPLPRLQRTTIMGTDGPRYRLDGTYDDHHLVVEIDGHTTHATRRQRQADAERDMRLQAAGQRVIRFTYEDIVERPHHVAATTATFLGITLPVESHTGASVPGSGASVTLIRPRGSPPGHGTPLVGGGQR
jgi:very-short-patch-repair endonuclease